MESNLTNISLPLTLGLDPITNEPISIDLGKCGNILLAGATKQGKSHCIHNMISRMNALPTPPKIF
jgi:DNA segregation ATPase FtsK/SpoIIIE-like protein